MLLGRRRQRRATAFLLALIEVVNGSRNIVISQDGHALESCLGDHYYGSYNRGRHVFIAPDKCVEEMTRSALVDDATIISGEADYEGECSEIVDGPRYIWIQPSGVDESLGQPELHLEEIIDKSTSLHQEILRSEIYASREQTVFKAPAVTLIASHWTNNSALLLVDPLYLPVIDHILPDYYVAVVLPISPLPNPARIFNDDADKWNSTHRLQRLLANLTYSSEIASIINSFPVPQMLADIQWLTGENNQSTILTRHSFTQGALTAAAWISDRIEETGAKCELQPFLSGFAPNVICRYEAAINTTETILLSGHYDSRGSFGNTRAPGGDDDGSGSLSILTIARTIARHGIRFNTNVELATFAGEEQGLLGSRFYANQMREDGRNLTLMIQADMLAYHSPGEPAQLAIPDAIGSKTLTKLVLALAPLYSPELTTGFTPACCSDHQSFHEQGFDAVMVFERAGGITDPMYHNSGDLSLREGWDIEQVRSITKVTFAALLHASGFEYVPPPTIDEN